MSSGMPCAARLVRGWGGAEALPTSRRWMQARPDKVKCGMGSAPPSAKANRADMSQHRGTGQPRPDYWLVTRKAPCGGLTSLDRAGTG